MNKVVAGRVVVVAVRTVVGVVHGGDRQEHFVLPPSSGKQGWAFSVFLNFFNNNKSFFFKLI